MDYNELFRQLKERVNYEDDVIGMDDGQVIRNFSFSSGNGFILPGESDYLCKIHQCYSDDTKAYRSVSGISGSILDIHDAEIMENKRFRYHVMSPADAAVAGDFILLIHGFNEKSWIKYLPWAKILVEQTGKSVILFPIAFHMNRAPLAWSDRHEMGTLSESRKASFPDIVACTFSNVAISARLQQKPQRFFWSGLQTYYDVIELLTEIKNGTHPFIQKDARFDLFAYSIGGLLAQILMMTDHQGFFTDSRLCLFCGGNVFNRFSPVSKFILDSEANVALYSYIIEHLENHLKKDERLRHYLSELHPEGMNFKAMLNYNQHRGERESSLRKISDRILAIALEKDVVAPPYEVINTLKGINRDIPIEVIVEDFDYPYIHENPFPSREETALRVTAAFNRIFSRVSRFFN